MRSTSADFAERLRGNSILQIGKDFLLSKLFSISKISEVV